MKLRCEDPKSPRPILKKGACKGVVASPRKKSLSFCNKPDVHYFIAAPPAYHLSQDGFVDENVEESFNIEELTVRELRESLVARKLPSTGNKAELVARLREAMEKAKHTEPDPHLSDLFQRIEAERAELDKRSSRSPTRESPDGDTRNYQQMTLTQLRVALRARKLKVTGTKEELVARLTS